MAVEEGKCLHKYIRAIITATRSLETLLINFEEADEDPMSGPNISFDGLVNHLACRHGLTLRKLHMRSMFVGFGAFKQILTEFVVIEDLGLAVDMQALVWNLSYPI